ncbi:hypothetical protein Tco_1183866 [Tanacetum coccineum]
MVKKSCPWMTRNYRTMVQKPCPGIWILRSYQVTQSWEQAPCRCEAMDVDPHYLMSNPNKYITHESPLASCRSRKIMDYMATPIFVQSLVSPHGNITRPIKTTNDDKVLKRKRKHAKNSKRNAKVGSKYVSLYNVIIGVVLSMRTSRNRMNGIGLDWTDLYSILRRMMPMRSDRETLRLLRGFLLTVCRPVPTRPPLCCPSTPPALACPSASQYCLAPPPGRRAPPATPDISRKNCIPAPIARALLATTAALPPSAVPTPLSLFLLRSSVWESQLRQDVGDITNQGHGHGDPSCNKALTWWNGQIQVRGRDAANGMSWNDFKALLVEEFCPSNEMEKLELELWNYKDLGEGKSLPPTNRPIS